MRTDPSGRVGGDGPSPGGGREHALGAALVGLLVALSLPGLRLVSHGFYRYDARPMSFLLGLTMTVYLVLLAGLALVILLLLRTGRHSERPVAATHHAPPS